MATQQRITAPVGVSGNATSLLPYFQIPHTAEVERWTDTIARVGFSVDSGVGQVEVTIHTSSDTPRDSRVECEGSSAALLAAGIVAPEWLIDGRPSWCVISGDEGPRVVVGSKGCPKGRYVNIRKGTGKRGYRVTEVLTAEQRDDYSGRIAELLERCGGARQNEGEQQEDIASVSAGQAYMMTVANTDTAIAWLTEQIEKTGHRYTDDSMGRIHRAYEELRRAVADGCLVEVRPRLQHAGNVICWPGRGSVPPVMLHV